MALGRSKQTIIRKSDPNKMGSLFYFEKKFIIFWLYARKYVILHRVSE